MKCSHLEKNVQQKRTDDTLDIQQYVNEGVLSPRPRRGPPIGLTLYDNQTEQPHSSAENDLKFVLYMYEVRKMRDIYGRISEALDIIKKKK